jgi:hypothetical protein
MSKKLLHISYSKTGMHVLFLALTIYLLGVTIVLYLRPALMFHPGGTWKEFSLNPDPNHTWMPFWLFSILWAFVSYLVAAALQRLLLSSSDKVDISEDGDGDGDGNDIEEIPVVKSRRSVRPQVEMEIEAEPVSKTMGLNTSKNGFYVLNTQKYNTNHVPSYVYYGDQPPEGFKKT